MCVVKSMPFMSSPTASSLVEHPVYDRDDVHMTLHRDDAHMTLHRDTRTWHCGVNFVYSKVKILRF